MKIGATGGSPLQFCVVVFSIYTVCFQKGVGNRGICKIRVTSINTDRFVAPTPDPRTADGERLGRTETSLSTDNDTLNQCLPVTSRGLGSRKNWFGVRIIFLPLSKVIL